MNADTLTVVGKKQRAVETVEGSAEGLLASGNFTQQTSSTMNDPNFVVVSFYSSDRYYVEAAERLRGDCQRLGMDSDIVELVGVDSTDWIGVCRRKIHFYLEMYYKHQRPILWVDVDSRISRVPVVLNGAKCDIAGFLRGIRYLRDFDTESMPRFFSPFAMFFNFTPATTAFLELMATIERKHNGVAATDDFFLHEAWVRHDEQLSVLILPPSLVARQWPPPPATFISIGSSGNVSRHRSRAQQHPVAKYSIARRCSGLIAEAEIALAQGEMADWESLLMRALKISAPNDALARRLAVALRSMGRRRDAHRFLSHYRPAEPLDIEKRLDIEEELHLGREIQAARTCNRLIRGGTVSDRNWGRRMAFRIELQRRGRGASGMRCSIPWRERAGSLSIDDLIPFYVTEKLTCSVPIAASSDYVCVGGAIMGNGKALAYWGAGISNAGDNPPADGKYPAVRGPLTRRRILAAGGNCPQVYGGPSCLLPEVYRPQSSGPRHSLGIVCNAMQICDLDLASGISVILSDVGGYEDVETLIDKICECRAVLTTSVEVMMISHAYGVPAWWFVFSATHRQSEVIFDDGAAFLDYAESVGWNDRRPIEVSPNATLTIEAFKRAELPTNGLNVKAFLAAAPFPVLYDIHR